MEYNLIFENVNGISTIIKMGDKESAIRQADSIAKCLLNVSIMSELNKMQMEATQGKEEVATFHNKFAIPDYFINLILCKYHMRIAPVK